jgi:hypothetical protein
VRELVRDEVWTYPGMSGLARRRLRVWQIEDRGMVAVLTERPSDTGTSITNAAQAICMQLEREYPADQLVVVEHYPGNDPGSRYSTVALDGAMHPTWRHLPDEAACRMLPGLEPDGPAPAEAAAGPVEGQG